MKYCWLLSLWFSGWKWLDLAKSCPFIAKWWALSRNEVHAPAVHALAAPAVHALTALADYSALTTKWRMRIYYTLPPENLSCPHDDRQKPSRKEEEGEREKNRYLKWKIPLLYFRINARMRANTKHIWYEKYQRYMLTGHISWTHKKQIITAQEI